MYLVYNRLLSIIVIVRCHQETTILVGEHDAYVPQGFESPSTNLPRSGDNPSLVPSPHRSNKVDPNLNPLSSFSALDGGTDGGTEEVAKFGRRNERESEQRRSGADIGLRCARSVRNNIFCPWTINPLRAGGPRAAGRAASLVLESRG